MDYELLNFYQFSLGPQGLTIGAKLTISFEFSTLQVKWWYHIFSSMIKEKYVESELSGIFRVKVLTKNVVFGSLGTQCKTAFAVWCLSLKKQTNNILCEKMSFCLVNWAFLFVDSRRPISCRKVAKIFHAYES